MFDLINLRRKHGRQAIANLQNARLPESFRGFPLLDDSKCQDDGAPCVEVCPSHAIDLAPLRLDLGKCIFCGECQHVCSGAIRLTPGHMLGSSRREYLSVTSKQSQESYAKTAIESTARIHRLFGRSLKLRQVSAGGCNGCETELVATGNVNFDMSRFGIDFVASPRHADGVVITGPVSKNMASALRTAFLSISKPRLVIAAGACAISGGLFEDSPELDRTFFDEFAVDLYIPGCPPHPLTFINAITAFVGKK